jgi:hypothetical protein
MDGSERPEKRVPVAFVQLANGTVYAACRPANERSRVRGVPFTVKPVVPKDAEYEKASDEWSAHLRHLGHEDG